MCIYELNVLGMFSVAKCVDASALLPGVLEKKCWKIQVSYGIDVIVQAPVSPVYVSRGVFLSIRSLDLF